MEKKKKFDIVIVIIFLAGFLLLINGMSATGDALARLYVVKAIYICSGIITMALSLLGLKR